MNKESLIEKYFLKQLTNVEETALQTLLETDKAFKKEFEFQKNIQLAFRNETRNELKTAFQKIDMQQKKSWKTPLLIAASFAFLIALGSYFYTQPSNNSKQLFAQNFEVYPNVIHPVVRGDETQSTLEKAFVYYENKDFTHFIKTLESNNYTKPDYNFYLANAYLAEGNTTQSIALLQSYLNQQNMPYHNEATWYLALAYLKQGATKKAKKYLEKVVASKTEYTANAADLISKMKKIGLIK